MREVACLTLLTRHYAQISKSLRDRACVTTKTYSLHTSSIELHVCMRAVWCDFVVGPEKRPTVSHGEKQDTNCVLKPQKICSSVSSLTLYLPTLVLNTLPDINFLREYQNAVFPPLLPSPALHEHYV